MATGNIISYTLLHTNESVKMQGFLACRILCLSSKYSKNALNIFEIQCANRVFPFCVFRSVAAFQILRKTRCHQQCVARMQQMK